MKIFSIILTKNEPQRSQKQSFKLKIGNKIHIAGLPSTNMEGDLKVEHQNCDFKAGLLNLSGIDIWLLLHSVRCSYIAGNYTEDSLQRIAKSVVMSKLLKEKIVPHYKERYNIKIIIG